MEQNVFLRLAQERYTTKHYSGREISARADGLAS